MPKHRVLLVCPPHIFGESLESILRAAKDVTTIGPFTCEQDILSQIVDSRPDVVVLAGENAQDDSLKHLAACIIEQHPDLPIICTELRENLFRVFSTHTLPAHRANLLETIRKLPVNQSDATK